MFRRILKTISALAAGHGIQTLTQLLLPPVFIAAYGVKGYGEWLVLSAAVGYLGTLDFGLQTYVVNELTGLYHRNEMEKFHRVQSVGLWLMIFFVLAGTVFAGIAFFLPFAGFLRIAEPQSIVSWAVFCLALQVLASIPLGQIIGVYRAFGQAHLGVMWGNLYRIMLLALTLVLAWLRAPFWLIAAGQVLAALAILLMALLSLRWSKPEVSPRLDYWDAALARNILKPSAFFGLFILNNVFVYQAPILILQRFVGAEIVVVFSVARTFFSFVRQGAALLQQSIAPEVTRLYGIGDKVKLVRLYILFESVVLAVVLMVNAGFLLASPVLLKLWLKRPELFDLRIFIPVMLISTLSSIKEYKMYFQYATNHHTRVAVVTFFSYLVATLVALPAIRWLGIAGFISVWLAVELIQLLAVHVYNARLFEGHLEVTLWPAVRLGAGLVAIVLLTFAARSLLVSDHYVLQGLTACSAVVAFAGVSYFLFNLREVVRVGRGQVLKLRFG